MKLFGKDAKSITDFFIFISTIILVLESSIYVQGKELFFQDLMQILSSSTQIQALR